MATSDRNRIDVWLKLVCLFKHRSEAAEACRGGHVKVNGQRVKPAATVREGDIVEFYLRNSHRQVLVRGLPAAGVSKKVARTMYVDQTPPRDDSLARTGGIRERGTGRPTKKDRRATEKLKR